MLFFSADDDGIAVQQVPGGGGTEGTDVLNLKDAPVRPGDDPGLHIAGPVKDRGYFHVDTIRQETTPPIQD